MILIRRISIKNWCWLGVFNFLLVGIMGVLMRMKFLLPIPALNLKYLQHAHSHFAFVGWVSHMLMLFMLAVVFGLQRNDHLPWRHSLVLLANQLFSFGMLFSFLYQGYGVLSITCSTVSILLSYFFAIFLWRDMRRQRLDRKIRRWFVMALLFMVISSFGTFYLAYMMASQDIDVKRQLSAIYFYLHFQYNGWFFFAIMGLTHYMLRKYAGDYFDRQNDQLFSVLCAITAPLYLLSVLWWDMGRLVYGLLVVMAILQCGAWGRWMVGVYQGGSRLVSERFHPILKKALGLVCWAVLLKFCLQVLSVVPALSDYVYGFRPVIIGYLHLVLLLIVSVFLLSYLYQEAYLSWDKYTSLFYVLFIVGVLFNEVLLAVQAALSIWGTGFPSAHLYLLVASLVICSGLLGLLIRSLKSYRST